MCGAQGGERVGASGRRVSDAARVTSTARRAWLPAAAVGWKTTSCMQQRGGSSPVRAQNFGECGCGDAHSGDSARHSRLF